jgi:hypothetical protein
VSVKLQLVHFEGSYKYSFSNSSYDDDEEEHGYGTFSSETFIIHTLSKTLMIWT